VALRTLLSPRLLARLVAVLLVAALAALPVVDEDSDAGAQVAASGAPGAVGHDDEPSDAEVEVAPGPVPADHDVDGSGVFRVRVPRAPAVPPVTVPSIPTPTLPPITLPSFTDERARAACVAATTSVGTGGEVLADEGAYTAMADGSDLRRVARSVDPGTWDAGHRRLAYQAAIDPTLNALCVKDGTAVRAVGTVRPFGGFAGPGAGQLWASGNRLAAVNDGGRTPALQLYDAGGGGKVRDISGVYPHDISPDGRTLAFVSGWHPDQVLNVADLDTGAVRQVARLDQDRWTGFFLRWLPDGSGVAYKTSGIHVINVADGTRRTLVSDDNGGAGSYAFAPDGRLAYTTYLGGQDEGRLYVAAADGSNPTQVADGPVGYMAWSPAGDRLLVAAGRGNEASLQTVRADGTERRTLLRAAARPGEHWLRFVLNSAWTPDGTRIAFGLWRHPAADSVAT
jgi:hypothetical protein